MVRMAARLSSPNHEIQIDLVSTFGTNGSGHRDSALFTVRADIRIEEDFHVITKSGTTLAARLMNELEIPYSPTMRAIIVGQLADFAINIPDARVILKAPGGTPCRTRMRASLSTIRGASRVGHLSQNEHSVSV